MTPRAATSGLSDPDVVPPSEEKRRFDALTLPSNAIQRRIGAFAASD